MSQPSVAGVIDVVIGQNVQARRQRADAQPVAGVEHDGSLLIGAQEVAAGVEILFQSADRTIHRGLRGSTGQQLASQQSTTARPGGGFAFGTVGDRHEHALGVDAEPGCLQPRDRCRLRREQGRPANAEVRRRAGSILPGWPPPPRRHPRPSERTGPAGTSQRLFSQFRTSMWTSVNRAKGTSLVRNRPQPCATALAKWRESIALKP